MLETLQFFTQWGNRTMLPPNHMTGPKEAAAFQLGVNVGFKEVASVSASILDIIFGTEPKKEEAN